MHAIELEQRKKDPSFESFSSKFTNINEYFDHMRYQMIDDLVKLVVSRIRQDIPDFQPQWDVLYKEEVPQWLDNFWKYDVTQGYLFRHSLKQDAFLKDSHEYTVKRIFKTSLITLRNDICYQLTLRYDIEYVNHKFRRVKAEPQN